MKLDSGEHDGTKDTQYMTVVGILGETEEERCDASFDVKGQEVICTVESKVRIGEYRCVRWRTAGGDGLRFTQVTV